MECCVGAGAVLYALDRCCTAPYVAAEFVHLVSSEANEICNKDNKKTIAPDHVLKALTVRRLLYSVLK